MNLYSQMSPEEWESLYNNIVELVGDEVKCSKSYRTICLRCNGYECFIEQDGPESEFCWNAVDVYTQIIDRRSLLEFKQNIAKTSDELFALIIKWKSDAEKAPRFWRGGINYEKGN